MKHLFKLEENSRVEPKRIPFQSYYKTVPTVEQLKACCYENPTYNEKSAQKLTDFQRNQIQIDEPLCADALNDSRKGGQKFAKYFTGKNRYAFKAQHLRKEQPLESGELSRNTRMKKDQKNHYKQVSYPPERAKDLA